MLKKFSFMGATLFSLSSFSQTKNFLDQPYIEVAGTADTLVIPNKITLKIVLSEKIPVIEYQLKKWKSKWLMG